MQKTVGEYSIEIYEDPTFTANSADNVHDYDAVYTPDTEYKLATKLGIKLYKDNILIKSAFVGWESWATGIADDNIIANDSKIVLCCADSVLCLSVPGLELLWRTKADYITCFGIFEYQDDYIVHGELEISRLNNKGEILWQYGGADIFVYLGEAPGFELTPTCIIARDFENSVYYIGYDGSTL